MNIKKLEANFKYHPSNEVTIYKKDDLRAIFLELAMKVNDILEDGMEKELSIEKLKESLFWAIEGIAEEDEELKRRIEYILNDGGE